MLSLFSRYLRKKESARERLNGQDSKTDRASIAAISLPVHAVQATSSYAESRSTSAEWIARAAIIFIACGMAWYTWGHWGDFQIDNGRELYVPVSILHGKLLYRDIWYMYGPLAPYLQALLFRIFGIHLNVLYGFGLLLTIASALVTFEIARRFRLPLPASLVPSLFFLLESYYPFIFNFIFPYSYAATLGSFLGLACLYFVLKHASRMRTLDLGFAALLASLALLTKQEFGFACLVLLAFDVVVRFLIRRSSREFMKSAGVCLAGLAPSLAVYGGFIWKLSARVLFYDNWISTPGTYYMRTIGKFTMAEQGFRFAPAELLQAAGLAVMAMTIWAVVTYLNIFAIDKSHSRSSFFKAVLVFGQIILFAIVLKTPWAARILLNPLTEIYPRATFHLNIFFGIQKALAQVLFPKGLFFLGLIFALQAIWSLRRNPERALHLEEALLGIYATLIGVRVMMELWPSVYKYAVFFNLPLFLVFVILVYRVIRWATRSLAPQRQNVYAGYMLGAEATFLFILLFPNPRSLPSPVNTGVGIFYSKPDVAILFPQIISFMKTHTKNGKDILVLPEPPSLYVFAGMQGPSRWYSLLPGVIPPEHEQEFINELVLNKVRYILISNRATSEYGVKSFGVGYNQQILQWIKENFAPIGQFGPLAGETTNPPYTVMIYEKKDVGQTLSQTGSLQPN